MDEARERGEVVVVEPDRAQLKEQLWRIQINNSVENPKHLISLFYPLHDSQFCHVCVLVAGLLPDRKERQSKTSDICAVCEVEPLC